MSIERVAASSVLTEQFTIPYVPVMFSFRYLKRIELG